MSVNFARIAYVCIGLCISLHVFVFVITLHSVCI
jgi:hypothetical protein